MDSLTPSRLAGALAALVLVAASPAAQADPARPDPSKPVARKDAPPLRAAPGFCDRYGAGFMRVEGTDTCIRIGGSVTVDAYATEGTVTTRGSAIAPALRSK